MERVYQPEHYVKLPEIPADDAERLKQLHSLQLLDTEPEERFDRLTRMGCRLFNVKTCVISLVDEHRQWFKSRQGIDATETDRCVSFCGHAILTGGIFEVQDTLRDSRFFDNPLVIGEPFIRFYAGCSIRSGGYTMGTICILDSQPRKLSDEDKLLLSDLAASVESEMEAHQIAHTDELTGLINRRGFYMVAGQVVKLVRREKHSLGISLLDLNDFKQINDKFGHIVGDRALQAFASLIAKVFRESDMVARIGGDEFVCLHSDIDEAGLEVAKKRLAEEINAFNQRTHEPFRLSYAHGTALFSKEQITDSLDALLHAADSSMYTIKSQQRRQRQFSTGSE